MYMIMKQLVACAILNRVPELNYLPLPAWLKAIQESFSPRDRLRPDMHVKLSISELAKEPQDSLTKLKATYRLGMQLRRDIQINQLLLECPWIVSFAKSAHMVRLSPAGKPEIVLYPHYVINLKNGLTVFMEVLHPVKPASPEVEDKILWWLRAQGYYYIQAHPNQLR